MSKYYAVRKGKQTGIFETWDDCKRQTQGYPRAEYKSFTSREDAELYMKGQEFRLPKKEFSEPSNDCVNVYAVGKVVENYIGIGVLVRTGSKSFNFYAKASCLSTLPNMNIAGELLSNILAIQLCKDMGFVSMRIFYKYEGVEKFATKVWKAKQDLPLKYQELVTNMKDLYNLSLSYEGGNGCKHMKIADKLAKKGLTTGASISVKEILEGTLSVSDVSLTSII